MRTTWLPKSPIKPCLTEAEPVGLASQWSAAPAERGELLQHLLGEAVWRQLDIFPIPPVFKLSVIIPVYNERHSVDELVRRVQAVAIPKEIVIVDDGSTDGTRALLRDLPQHPDLTVLFLSHNQGKGAAIRAGFRHATGTVILIQDADLEYDPADYLRLLRPILDGSADIVYGSRFLGQSHRVLYFWHAVANKILTTFSNGFTNLNLTDMETGYKVFRREVLADLHLKSNRFGFEPEFTAKVAKRRNPNWRIFEVPIRYCGRTYQEGKKIGLRDAAIALYCIVRFWLCD
jgi:glycosyltransferase involved in cell wall biosynthesis